MELYHLYFCLCFGYLFMSNLHSADGVSKAPIKDTDDGIWALTARYIGIYLANYDVTEVPANEWRTTFAESDVEFDPVKGLLIYCIAVLTSSGDYECRLHKTSLDKCYDDHFLTIPMDLVYGMELDSESRLLYFSSLLIPGIYEVNLDTGQNRILFSNEENIYHLKFSSEERYLYWTQFDINVPNTIRRGNIDGSGTPITIFSRPARINGFGIDYHTNRFYYTQDHPTDINGFTATDLFSTDMNGNDERKLLTDTNAKIWEMTIDNGYLYWGDDAGNFRRISVSGGDPSSNTIETLTTITNELFINHRLITASEISMSKAVLSLNMDVFTAYENEQSLTIEVLRTGNLFRCSCVDVIVTTGARRLARATIETTIEFTPEDESESFTVTWTDNDTPDSPDHVTVDLVINSDDIIGEIQTADVIIRDDECGYFFDDTDVSVNEDIGFVDVIIKRNCSDMSLVTFTQPVHIEAVELDGSARGGTDFIPGTIKVNFAPGKDIVRARAWLVDNNQPEQPERFALSLILPDNGLLLEPNLAVVTIVDYDNFYILTHDKYEVLESNGSVEIVIQRIGNTTLPGTVRVAARGQDAEFLKDFVADPSLEVVHFDSGISEVIATISITDDDILESNETFQVFLHSPVGGSLNERKMAVVSIIDNDVEVAMADSQFSCLESHGCYVDVVRRGFLNKITTAHVKTEDFSASAGSDFIAVDMTLTFDPWVTVIATRVILVNDEIKEPHANFIFAVTDVSEGLIGEPSQANVALWDDDSELPLLVYSLERISYNARESDGQIEVAILRDGSYLGQLGSVRVQALPVSDDTASVDDFVNPDTVVEFDERQSRQVLSIAIVNDDLIEDLEAFTVQLADVENGVLGDETEAKVTIQDDDALFYMDKTTYRVNEVLRQLEIIVHRVGYLQEPGFVTLQITGGNSTIYDDYQFSPIGQILQFPPGETRKSVIIEIVDDTVAEGTETIDIILSRAQHGTLGNPASAVVVIEDNDIVIESSTAASPSQSRQQIGTTGVIIIVVAVVVVLIVCILLCTLSIMLCYSRRPSSWPFLVPPQLQLTTGQPHSSSKLPQSPYANFGHVVRRLSGRVVRRLSNRLYRSPYTNRRQSLYRQPVNTYTSNSHNQLVLYGTTNPMFDWDLYGQDSNLEYRPVFNAPRVQRQLALPPTRGAYYR